MSIPAWIEYLTKPGDRWDLIAWRMYGDATAFEIIIVANPSIPIAPVLDGGIKIRIPLREPAELAALNPLALPPWKRAAGIEADLANPPWKRP